MTMTKSTLQLRLDKIILIKMAVQKVKFNKTTTGLIDTHLYLFTLSLSYNP